MLRGNILFVSLLRYSSPDWRIFSVLKTIEKYTFQDFPGKHKNEPQGIPYESQCNPQQKQGEKWVFFHIEGRALKIFTATLKDFQRQPKSVKIQYFLSHLNF